MLNALHGAKVKVSIGEPTKPANDLFSILFFLACASNNINASRVQTLLKKRGETEKPYE